MELYTPGCLDWADSQLIYHALADLGRESLCLVRPDRPYISLGFSQEPVQELDLDFCDQACLPLFRREVGGGLVLLDQDQLFFEVVLDRGHPLVNPNREIFYRRLLEPAIRAYNQVGIKARFQPINDIAVEDRKISGTGAGEIGECVAFVGNIILDFNSGIMARAVKSPDRQFRMRMAQLMAGGIGSLKSELGPDQAWEWTHHRLTQVLIQEFSALLGPFTDGALDPELTQAMAARREKMLSPQWLHRKGRRIKGRRVKIRSGLELVQNVFPFQAGQVKVLYEARDGSVHNLSLFSEESGAVPDNLKSWADKAEGLPEKELPGFLAGFGVDPN